MKPILYLLATFAWVASLPAQTPANSPTTSTNTPRMGSTVFDWEKMKVETTTNGVRRSLFDAPTATVDKLHCHITTLNPGQSSGAPRRHLQEEVIIVKEGLIEATADGHSQTVGPGSVIFFAAHAVTCLRNAGDKPATYTVVYFYTPLTPKE